MTGLTTTLNAIRAHDPCAGGWTKLLRSLGKTEADDEPLTFERILESNGLDDALWACRSAPQHDRGWRLLAVRFAREVQHLMADPRSVAALDVAERYARGEATDAELEAARAAAGDAARDAAGDAARDAAGDAAWGAAGDAAWAAVWAAARAAAWEATWAAAGDAAWAAARAAARQRQREIFLQTVRTGRVPEAVHD